MSTLLKLMLHVFKSDYSCERPTTIVKTQYRYHPLDGSVYDFGQLLDIPMTAEQIAWIAALDYAERYIVRPCKLPDAVLQPAILQWLTDNVTGSATLQVCGSSECFSMSLIFDDDCTDAEIAAFKSRWITDTKYGDGESYKISDKVSEPLWPKLPRDVPHVPHYYPPIWITLVDEDAWYTNKTVTADDFVTQTEFGPIWNKRVFDYLLTLEGSFTIQEPSPGVLIAYVVGSNSDEVVGFGKLFGMEVATRQNEEGEFRSYLWADAR